MSSPNFAGMNILGTLANSQERAGKRAKQGAAWLSALPGLASSTGERLDSWKEIAAYFKRSVRCVQRWECNEEMPVHRHGHNRAASIYAHASELDVWRNSRGMVVAQSPQSCSPSIPGDYVKKGNRSGAVAMQLTFLQGASRQWYLDVGECEAANCQLVLIFVCQHLAR